MARKPTPPPTPANTPADNSSAGVALAEDPMVQPEAAAAAPPAIATVGALLESVDSCQRGQAVEMELRRDEAMRRYVAILANPALPGATVDIAAMIDEGLITAGQVQQDAETIEVFRELRTRAEKAEAARAELVEKREALTSAKKALEEAEKAMTRAVAQEESAVMAQFRIVELVKSRPILFAPESLRISHRRAHTVKLATE